MHRGYLATLLLASALALPLAGTGCAEHRYARVYDPYYHDYHRWGPDEDRYYTQWETEHHMEHREYAQRSPAQQKEYWDWRHGQSGHDHDHDHNKH